MNFKLQTLQPYVMKRDMQKHTKKIVNETINIFYFFCMGYMIAALWNKVDVETTYQFNCHFNALTICSRHNLKKCNNSTTQANQHNDLVCGHEKRGTTE